MSLITQSVKAAFCTTLLRMYMYSPSWMYACVWYRDLLCIHELLIAIVVTPFRTGWDKPEAK